MALTAPQPDMLVLLHHQHRFYTNELAKTHRSLGKLYKKLTRTERALQEWKGRELTRKDKKKLQWNRGTTKSQVRALELQQAFLHDYLHQCNDLIASYDTPQTGYHLPSTPWTAHLPPMGFGYEPYTPMPATSWTAGSFQERQQQQPQYWDLSMLRERRQSTPASGSASADSGYHEPANALFGQAFHYGEVNDPNHVWAHELMQASTSASSDDASQSKKSSVSEKDNVPELPIVVAGAVAEEEVKPKSPHRRRYSENAIQLIEHRLSAAKATHIGPVPQSLKRTASEGPKADRVASEGAEH